MNDASSRGDVDAADVKTVIVQLLRSPTKSKHEFSTSILCCIFSLI